MKGLVTKAVAVLLIVWYSMSIIGFGVHTCNASGRSFVSTFIEGLTCEDIHPDHDCGSSSCCSGSHEEHSCCDGCEQNGGDCLSFKEQSCCYSDYQVITLTGMITSDDSRYNGESAFSYCMWMELPAREINVRNFSSTFIAYDYRPDSGHMAACDMQAVLKTWRI